MCVEVGVYTYASPCVLNMEDISQLLVQCPWVPFSKEVIGGWSLSAPGVSGFPQSQGMNFNLHAHLHDSTATPSAGPSLAQEWALLTPYTA